MQRAVLRSGVDTCHCAVLGQQVGDFGFHAQMKSGIELGFFRDEVQKFPLRHQADKFTVRGQMRKIPDGDCEVVHLSADLRKLLMRAAQKVF